MGKESLPHHKRPKSHQLLADYLEQRFEQKVRGKTDDSAGNRVINHSDFFHFYRSQLSKITTLVINSYCTKLDKDFNWNPSPTAQQKSDLLDLLKDSEQAKSFFTGVCRPYHHRLPIPPPPEHRPQATTTGLPDHGDPASYQPGHYQKLQDTQDHVLSRRAQQIATQSCAKLA